ncbi:MAG: ABC transporter ATP-binding protein, partial [Myxococcales bacterium]|nr:ABC transporter ATP-binding protein [Myxococcales bacterium]
LASLARFQSGDREGAVATGEKLLELMEDGIQKEYVRYALDEIRSEIRLEAFDAACLRYFQDHGRWPEEPRTLISSVTSKGRRRTCFITQSISTSIPNAPILPRASRGARGWTLGSSSARNKTSETRTSAMTSDTVVLSVQDVTKRFRTHAFKPPFQALRGVSFSVNRGEICGFLGPNGAGKTTTIKALLGLIRADSGKLEILGGAPSSAAWRSRIGYMPEHPNFYDFLSGHELVVWFGRLLGLPRKEAEARADVCLDRVGLTHAKHKRLRTYSKGMLQRAGLAQAIVGRPELLILDEPMTGLDPIGRKDMRELIKELASEGVTIFYSTHILPDIELTCDRVTIIHRGSTLRTATVQDLLLESTRKVTVEVEGLDSEGLVWLKGQVRDVSVENSVSFEASSEEDATAILATLLRHGATIRRLEPHRATLEEVFVRVLQRIGRDEALAPRHEHAPRGRPS